MNNQEYQQILAAIDQSLALFGEPPLESGFDLEIYHELRKVRESLIRAHRDRRNENLTRDSRSPLGQP